MKKFIDKLAYIHIQDKKILMSLSKGKSTWYIPGGKRDKDESDTEALEREVEEELSVNLISESFIKYGVFEAQAHGHPEGTVVRMTCYTADYKGMLKAASEIAKLEFFPYSRKSESSPVDHLIFDDLKKKGLL
ncbi:NUDIX hydrolase [Christiangramia forsetii]|uniref:Protein containing NUDIX domain n=2 Tax=Christiangramia forsetii TaxID=411153 RepID=A0M5X4_CHRFK|nr:NUDIX domain-containing protein [Christiangramia forsetii]GGG31979.1 DNA mismatch repair protein MutT [Christiangramia forsetii]CAL68019.1 protein containing NUDIX domain [Christiangramia forsetii KT0803]